MNMFVISSNIINYRLFRNPLNAFWDNWSMKESFEESDLFDDSVKPVYKTGLNESLKNHRIVHPKMKILLLSSCCLISCVRLFYPASKFIQHRLCHRQGMMLWSGYDPMGMMHDFRKVLAVKQDKFVVFLCLIRTTETRSGFITAWIYHIRTAKRWHTCISPCHDLMNHWNDFENIILCCFKARWTNDDGISIFGEPSLTTPKYEQKVIYEI